jgi:MerR family transcriptional regulator, redox-sensitive transcriptional activator SoxR
MTIGEVARRTGLRTSAIRYYERLGILPVAERSSGRRRYDERVLFHLEVIQFARGSGFTLEEIRTLLAGRPYSARLRRLAGRKIAELERSIERARAMQATLAHALRCRCADREDCGRRLRRHRTARPGA